VYSFINFWFSLNSHIFGWYFSFGFTSYLCVNVLMGYYEIGGFSWFVWVVV